MNRLDGPIAKVERAKHHVKELETALRAFNATKPYVVGTKRNPETRQLIYYLVSVRDAPPQIAAIAGEILQSLRSALDHLAYQLVLVGTSQSGPFAYVYFPIFDSAKEYEAGKHRQIKGMRQNAIDAIDAIKPYKGGNDPLWQLHKLNIVDKHRLLITVGSYSQSVDIGGHVFRELRRMHPDFPGISEVPDLSVFYKVADTMFPLKGGDELFVDRPDAEPDEKLQLTLDVALSEPGIIESQPIIETLHQMADLVGNLIPLFGPLLT